MSYILFSPVGGHDPIASYHDGAVLHICRVYKPEKVYLYLSHEMLERSRQDNRYCLSLEKLQKQLGYIMDIHRIERDELTQVQLFDTFYTDFDQLQQGFGDLNIKEEYIGSMQIMKIFEGMSKDMTLVEDLRRMRDVETNVRNVAAHEIISVTDVWIYRKTHLHAEDIMKLLKRLVISSGVKVKNDYWNSFDDMNRVIAERL